MASRSKILTALINLGDSSEKIRDSLKAKQCKGFKGSSYACPIALFLNKEFCNNMKVMPDKVGFHMPVHEKELTWLDAPKPVADFIHDFDAGKYPELDYNVRN